MRILSITILAFTMTITELAVAESMVWKCTYTDATYDAAFMSKPETRVCPQTKCSYDIRLDAAAGTGTVNGTMGYAVEKSPTRVVLRRNSENVVMGGLDTAVFTIDLEKMSFKSKKTTTPSVTVSTQGMCAAL